MGSAGPAVHVQYTTGAVPTFRALAGRLFGEEFADVMGVELGEHVGATAR